MPKSWLVALAGVTAGLLVLLIVTAATTAPVPGAKATDKWEYCELHYRLNNAARWGVPGGGPGGVGPGVFPGGGAGKGARPARQAQASVRLTMADEEIEATDWDALATKLKVAPAKKNAPKSAHKLRVLNHLGAAGWELVGATGNEAGAAGRVYTFKRKVAK